MRLRFIPITPPTLVTVGWRLCSGFLRVVNHKYGTYHGRLWYSPGQRHWLFIPSSLPYTKGSDPVLNLVRPFSVDGVVFP